MSSPPANESRFRRMTGHQREWSPGGQCGLQSAHSSTDENDRVEARTVGERHKRRHESAGRPDRSGHTTPESTQADVSANADDSSSENSESRSPEGNSFPKKVGTNEWLHADGQVYKKLMFVIRKDQSEALDVVLAAGRSELGKDRSSIMRNLLDHAGIKDSSEATRQIGD